VTLKVTLLKVTLPKFALAPFDVFLPDICVSSSRRSTTPCDKARSYASPAVAATACYPQLLCPQ